jgi:hypothetical protein
MAKIGVRSTNCTNSIIKHSTCTRSEFADSLIHISMGTLTPLRAARAPSRDIEAAHHVRQPCCLAPVLRVHQRARLVSGIPPGVCRDKVEGVLRAFREAAGALTVHWLHEVRDALPGHGRRRHAPRPCWARAQGARDAQIRRTVARWRGRYPHSHLLCGHSIASTTHELYPDHLPQSIHRTMLQPRTPVKVRP